MSTEGQRLKGGNSLPGRSQYGSTGTHRSTSAPQQLAEKDSAQGGHRQQGDRATRTSVSTACSFRLAFVMRVNIGTSRAGECRFQENDCRFTHVSALKDITRAAARAALKSSPNKAIRKSAEVYISAARGGPFRTIDLQHALQQQVKSNFTVVTL